MVSTATVTSEVEAAFREVSSKQLRWVIAKV